jgi:hypothetical protein
MHYRIGLEIPQGISEQLTVAQFTDYQVAVQNGPAVSSGEVVVNQYLIACFTKGLDDVAADIAGPAGHKDFLHFLLLNYE